MEEKRLIVEKALEKFKDTPYIELLWYFYNTLIDNVSEDNMRYFYDNIGTLDIKRERFLSLAEGYYDAETNTISLPKRRLDFKSLSHELLHMSSTVIKDGVEYCGFSAYDKSLNIGSGINEGYTELTNTRLFGKDEYISYELQILFAKLVEKIVGKEEMKNLYFNADLKGLINNLALYNRKEDARRFIGGVDKTIMCYPYIVQKYKEYQTTQMMNMIVSYLIKTYLNKLQYSCQENGSSSAEALHYFDKYVRQVANVLDANLIYKKGIVDNTICDNYDYGKVILRSQKNILGK